MIRNRLPLLKRIVGGIKRMFSNVVLQYGAVFVPLGFAMALYTLEFTEGWRAILGLIVSGFFFILGVIALSDAMKMARKEGRENNRKFNKLLEELQGLREDVKRMVNYGRDNNTNTKM